MTEREVNRARPSRREMLLSALAAAMFAACTPGATTPTGGPTPAGATPGGGTPAGSVQPATPAPAPTTAASTPVPPTATPAAVTPTPSFGGEADVEALIPDEVRGMTISKSSLSGQAYLDAASGGLAEAAEQINDFLAGLGRSIDDVSAATGNGFGEADHISIVATRVAGADGDALLDGLVQVHIASIPEFNDGMTGAATELTLGGKNVTLVTTTLGADFVYDESYYYAVGDVVFRLSGQTEETVADTLTLLP